MCDDIIYNDDDAEDMSGGPDDLCTEALLDNNDLSSCSPELQAVERAAEKDAKRYERDRI